MDDVNLQLVREFFELNVFRVLTNWQQDPRQRRAGENRGQLFVENARPVVRRELPFVLGAVDISGIERAVVEVRAWHADRFYPSVIESSPVLYQFVAEDALALARDVFSGQPFAAILVLSELPTTLEQRTRSMELLKAAGVQHVVEFPVLLRDMLNKVSVNASYTASQTLQTLRLLKRYKFIRNQQMEFPFSTEIPDVGPGPRVEVAEVSEPDDE
ncbi:MAG: hypothetical protein JXR94_13450 [Candidatus Hydrogenedentes bacterium]|nr:hypothetical protein [Candidatus Hydrogenedentota bacterium]